MREIVHTDCLYFNGYKPCSPHKTTGTHCFNCSEYQRFTHTILIVKLGRAGEVIRNTPLLHRLRQEYPHAKISWLTEYPSLVPKNYVDEIIPYSLNTIFCLFGRSFDIVYSLDKDIAICSLVMNIPAKIKKGFGAQHGAIIPLDDDAYDKWMTGIFDDLMKQNKRHYVEEIFEICGYTWNGEEYILPHYTVPSVSLPNNKPIIGVNTGAGDTWVTRVLTEQKLKVLIQDLMTQGYFVVLLGGEAEDKMNTTLAHATGASYFGTFSILDFIGLMNKCDLIITSVTFALHVAIGLQKKILLLNNIFPTNEFYLYGLGTILEPSVSCKYCYKAKFDANCETFNCLDTISNEEIITAVAALLTPPKQLSATT
ncbi:glycosyltransferase family 9 protein [Candidatus Woesearchaeota archaeon]|nr:glycosyltransferase family 9 protein [Candidatus Woesearchaeota archaeon]